MVGEDNVWPRSVEAQLHSGNAGDFWNIGDFAMKTDPDRTRGRNTVNTRPDSDTGETGIASFPSLIDRLSVREVLLTEGIQAGSSSWRIWGTSSLGISPVYTVPLDNCQTLVGYTAHTAGRITATVVVLDADGGLVTALKVAGDQQLRGLAAESNGYFGVLGFDPDSERIFVHRMHLTGAASWTTELTNATNHPDDFTIGDSRLSYGGGRYGAYYHTHSDDGHEGDTLKWVDISGAESTEWTWGCSHSMSNLLRYNDALGDTLSACVTDCYPGTSGSFPTNSIGGIYVDHSDGKVMDLDAACNGDVAGELGGMAPTAIGWALVFNGHQAPAVPGENSYDSSTMNQDIGLSFVDPSRQATPVRWLTDTPNIDENDATVAAWAPLGVSSDQLILGWQAEGIWQLVRMASDGEIEEGPVDISAIARWGRRDDPFRNHTDGDVVWSAFESAGSKTLKLARIDSGQAPTCLSF